MQRFLDILISGTALLLLSPVLLVVAVALKLTGEGHVFYTQERVGKGGKPFGIFKFATMLHNSPDIGAGDITLKHDPRVLPLGRILRLTKLNEIPQLWNILCGDLSIVGPRPMVPRTHAAYPLDEQAVIQTVLPGLTGVGSVVFRDEESYLGNEKSPREFYVRVIIPYKAQLERWYVEHRSIRLYFETVFLTAWVICFRKSELPWRVWPSLPTPPPELERGTRVLH